VRPREARFLGKAKNRESRVVRETEQRKGAQVVASAFLQPPPASAISHGGKKKYSNF
jgi:hypothetical protein